MAGFFPVFFKQYWSHGIEVSQSTYILGMANSASGLAIAVMAPFLGALADQGFGKKIFLGAFTLLGALTTASLAGVELGQWSQAAWLYGVSNFAFGGALVFYDAMLIDVSSHAKMDKISSYGYAAGYLGGGILFLVNVLMFLKPSLFGLSDGPAGIRASFITVAAWWLFFSLPLFLWVKERYRPASRPPLAQTLQRSWASLAKTFARLRRHKPLITFLVAYFIYIDGSTPSSRWRWTTAWRLALPPVT